MELEFINEHKKILIYKKLIQQHVPFFCNLSSLVFFVIFVFFVIAADEYMA